MDLAIEWNTALLLLILAVAALAAHKARRVHQKLFEQEATADRRFNNLFRQLEALDGLHRDLKLDRSLPPTRGWAASPDFLALVAAAVSQERPAVIAECSSGVSTVVLARGVQLNGHGHVFSLEHDPHYANKTRQELARRGLADFATVIDAPLKAHQIDGAEHSWYDFSELPAGIDLLVIDGPPEHVGPQARFPALPLLQAKLSAGATVFLDDAARRNETAAVERWTRDYGWTAETGLEAEKGIAKLKRSANRPLA